MKALIVAAAMLCTAHSQAARYGNPIDAPSGGGVSLIALAAVIGLFWWLGRK